jgi:hypothetical protein
MEQLPSAAIAAMAAKARRAAQRPPTSRQRISIIKRACCADSCFAFGRGYVTVGNIAAAMRSRIT